MVTSTIAVATSNNERERDIASNKFSSSEKN
jgi:hypothetical protein